MNNFSIKKQADRKSDFNSKPDNFETNQINTLMVKGFQKNKDKWRELCSYFRLIIYNIA